MESRVCHPLPCFESRLLIGRSSALTGPCCCSCSASRRPNWFDGSNSPCRPLPRPSLSILSFTHPHPQPPPPRGVCVFACVAGQVFDPGFWSHIHTQTQALTSVSGGEQRPCSSADVLQVAMECRRFELTVKSGPSRWLMTSSATSTSSCNAHSQHRSNQSWKFS